MKNVMVASFRAGQEAHPFTRLETYVQAQIENSMEVGWAAEDILLLTDFDYEYMGVKTQLISLDDPRSTSIKVFAMHALFRDDSVHDVLWVHDLDAWQNSWFDCPPFRDIGICEYSEYRRPSFGGGSVFCRPAAKDIVAAIYSLMSNRKAMDEETAFNEVLNGSAYKQRVTVLNSTYNMGCMNFAERYVRGDKPIRVCHFHPERREHIAIHLWGRNMLHAKTVDPRLERLIRRYFDVPPEPSDEGGGKA